MRREASSAQERWRARLARFDAQGDSVVRFCAREGVSAASFYAWRARLRSIATPATTSTPKASVAVARKAPAVVQPTKTRFIDAGRLSCAPSALSAWPTPAPARLAADGVVRVELDLGAGLVLRIVRGSDVFS